MPQPTTLHRALVVDDEPLIRWWLSEALGDRGCTVTEAADGQSAVKALSDSHAPFDVVLLDLRLPDSSDLQLLRRLHSLAPAAQIVLMTAFGAPELEREAMALGASLVIRKPFQIDQLAALVSPAVPPAA